MSPNDRNTLIFGILIILLLVVGYYFLLLSPLRSEFVARTEEREAKETQLQQLQQEVAELEAIADNAPDIERQLLELSKRVPTQPEIPSFVVQVEEISGAAGVTQLSIQPGDAGPPEGGGDFFSIPITMTFEGTYEQLQDFMVRLQNLVRLVAVSEVSYCRVPQLSPASTCTVETVEAGGQETTVDTNIEGLLQVEVVAEIYFQPGDVPSGQNPVAPAPPEAVTTPQGGTTGAQ